MNARNDAAARDERAEDRKQERRDDECDVPLPQHAALFLDHDRVEECCVDQPWKERRILDGIPRPVPAPSELDICPPHSEKNARGIEEPGEERPSAHCCKPFSVEAPRYESSDCKGEWNRRAHVSEVEIRRMDRHSRILQLGIHSASVGRNPIESLVGIGAEAHRRQEKDEHEREGS